MLEPVIATSLDSTNYYFNGRIVAAFIKV